MKKLAVVVVAYKLEDSLIEQFLKYNTNIENLFMVTDSKFEGEFIRIEAPEMEIFSISKCANIGIRTAIDAGFDIVLKTDIDCIITDEVKQYCLDIPARMAACWRHCNVFDPEKLHINEMDSRCIGSAVMHSQMWDEVNGYNEHMEGYGYDDGDLRFRTRSKGFTMPTLIKPKLYHVWHEEKHNRKTINPLKRVKNISLKNKYENPDWGIPEKF